MHCPPTFSGKFDGQEHLFVNELRTWPDPIGHTEHFLVAKSKYPLHGRHVPLTSTGVSYAH